MSRKESAVQGIALILCEIFTLFTIVFIAQKGQYSRLPIAVATLFLLLLPVVSQRIFHFRINLPVYMVMLFYGLGPMLGQCYNLYYDLCWWDKLLHTLGGVMFALVGLELFRALVDGDHAVMAAVFALCFSMAISMLWEFCEFGADTFLGMDMQQDTIITGFHSYLLGTETGVTGSIEGITEVVVNGQVLPGYIDIGLHDTMLDMLLETLGAAAVAVFHVASRGKYSAFRGCCQKQQP